MIRKKAAQAKWGAFPAAHQDRHASLPLKRSGELMGGVVYKQVAHI